MSPDLSRLAASRLDLSRWTLALIGLLVVTVACPLPAQEVIKGTRKKIKIDWAKHSSEHYTFRYESVIPAETIHKVAAELEDILKQYEKLFGYRHGKKFRVKFLDSLNTYEQEGGDPSHPGYYLPSKRYLVLRQMPTYRLIPTVYHEAFHQYLHAYVGDGVEIPIWYNEGMAMYYEGMQRDNNKAQTLNPKKIDKRKIRMVKEAIRTRSHIPLPKLIDATHEQFHEKDTEDLHYHESFSVMYFFMHNTRGKAAIKFAKTLKETKDPEAAHATLFGKGRKRLKKMEALWKSFTLKLDLELAAR